MSKRCPRCTKAVYLAEERIGAGQSWHVRCFTCASCKKGLDSTTLAENKGEIYCRACHGKLFGPKGFGYGQGAGALTNTGVVPDPNVHEASPAPVAAGRGKFCGNCGAADEGGKFCGGCGSALGGDASEAKFAAAPQAEAPAPAVNVFAAKSVFAAPVINPSGNPICPLCNKAVYHAEKIIGAGKTWHIRCFKCSACNKGLDSTTVTDKDGKIFCKVCYAKEFGPKGFGYGGGTMAYTQ